MLRRLLVSCLILGLTHGSCPGGFELARNGQCQELYGTMQLYADNATSVGSSMCVEHTAQLVSIHSEEDNVYWKGQGTAPNILLGLVCNTTSLKWQWTDGSEIDYIPAGNAAVVDFLTSECVPGVWWQMRSGEWGASFVRSGNHGVLLVDIFCIAQLHQPIPSNDDCDYFEEAGDDGVCYQIAELATNWQEAQLICRSFGADLASIHNSRENSFVRRLAVAHAEVEGIFLGGAVSGKGKAFAWTDGSEWNYDNFYPGFPVSGLGDCLVMDTEGTSGQWVNADCNINLSIACSRQLNYTTPGCSSGPWKEGEIIYLPGFPFDASTPCDFILSVDEGKRVEVTVHFLEANTCCDNLILFESYFGGNVVANLTGEVAAKTFTTTSSNFMRVSWQPNGGVNVRGMMITFGGV